MKISVSKEKLGSRAVLDYTDTQFRTLQSIEYVTQQKLNIWLNRFCLFKWVASFKTKTWLKIS